MGELVFLALLLAVCTLFYGMSFDFKTSILDTSGRGRFVAPDCNYFFGYDYHNPWNSGNKGEGQKAICV